MLTTEYTYRIQIDASVYIFNPLLDDNFLKFEIKNYKDECWKRINFDQEICLLKTDNVQLFDAIKFLVENPCECNTFLFQIYCKENNSLVGNWKIDPSNININKKPICLLKISGLAPDDKYQTLIESFNTKVDIIDKATKNAAIYCGELETISRTCSKIVSGTPLPANLDFSNIVCDSTLSAPLSWGVLTNNVQGFRISNPQNPNFGDYQLTITTTFVRECKTQAAAPLGTGWVQDGLKWCRPAATYNISNNNQTTVFNVNHIVVNETYEDVELTAGLSLETFFNCFACFQDTAGLNLCSNLFGINPDNTQPQNKTYDYALAHWQNLVLIRNDRLIRQNNSDAPTSMQVCFKEIWDALKCKFKNQLCLWYDGIKWRLEHKSYIFGLTISLGEAFDFEGMLHVPKKLKSKIVEYDALSPSEDNNIQIIYGGCILDDEPDKNTCDINVDVSHLLNNEAYVDNETDLLNWTLLQTYEEANACIISSDTAFCEGRMTLNGCLYDSNVFVAVVCESIYCGATLNGKAIELEQDYLFDVEFETEFCLKKYPNLTNICFLDTVCGIIKISSMSIDGYKVKIKGCKKTID